MPCNAEYPTAAHQKRVQSPWGWEDETPCCPSAGKGEIPAASAEGMTSCRGAHRAQAEQRHGHYCRALSEDFSL